MNYKKIDELTKRENMSFSDFFDKIGMTSGGYYQMLKAKTLKVEKLEKIAKYFKVDVAYFFDEEPIKVASPIDLQNKVNELYEENRMLMKENSSLKEKIHTLEKNNTVLDDVHVPKLKEKK